MFTPPKSRHKPFDWGDYFARKAQDSKDAALRRFYGAGLPDPLTPISEVPLMALDFETTGMHAGRHAIVSIGMVPFDLACIRPSQGYYRVVKPRRPLREESIAFHRITHSELDHAPDVDAILNDILARLAGHLVVVHYHNIERYFFDAAFMARRREHCLFPVIDTIRIEARFVRKQRFEWLKRFLGFTPPSIRLAASRERYGLPHYSVHHAKVDALATAELLQAQIAWHFSPDTPVGALWL